MKELKMMECIILLPIYQFHFTLLHFTLKNYVLIRL